MRKEYYNTENQMLDLYMINCGYEDCIDNFVSFSSIRNYYLIHYITKGSGYYETNGQKTHIAAGDIFLISPGQLVRYTSPDPKDTWSFCWIGFSGNKAKEYLNLTGITADIERSVNILFYRNIMECLAYIEDNKNNISQLKLNTYVLNCLLALTKNTVSKPVRAETHAERALSYIEYNYGNEITIKDVYTYLNLDRTYFYRIFKKHTGMAPEQYIMHYRIRKSLELLQYSKHSISEIASSVGINNVYYFSRLFRKIMNISPTEYRKTLDKTKILQ